MTRSRLLRTPIQFLTALAALLLATASIPGVALACDIDNVASLSANGARAALTASAPTSGSLWARFTFGQAFASGTAVQMSESRADLLRSLDSATVAAPYRWSFGDGAVTLGHVVTHRYMRPGLYRLVVDGWDHYTRRWFTFDNALLHIVPPGQVLQDNLGYYALRAFDVMMSSLMWVIDAALVALVLAVVAGRLRRRTIGDHSR